MQQFDNQQLTPQHIKKQMSLTQGFADVEDLTANLQTDSFDEQEMHQTDSLPPANPIQQKENISEIQVFNPFIENNKLPQPLIEALMNPQNYGIKRNQPIQNSLMIKSAHVTRESEQNEEVYKSLYDYYLKFNKQLVYKKYDFHDLMNPVQVNNKKYLATILYDFNKKHHQTESKMPKTSRGNLHFDANFESGNLLCAFEKSDHEYDLVLQNDINSKGHTQWFFFSVQIKHRCTVKFNILNLMKTGSLFQQGMQPVLFSEQNFTREKLGWFREGFRINYFKNQIKRVFNQYQYFQDVERKDRSFYTLTFTLNFNHDNDKIYIAHSYPYTFSQLGIYLNNVFSDAKQNIYIRRKFLTRTTAGNKCEILTISSPSLKQRQQRRGIFLLARQHPGEPQGSYMIEGAINYLLSDTPEAQYIRNVAIIKIVPMVNIDGVVVGNYRCALTGRDVNRRWKNPKKQIHPVIYRIKEVLKQFTKERQVRLVCDFHGHSRKMEAFLYGCITSSNSYIHPRVFPFLMSLQSQSISYNQCNFGISKDKDSTARARIFREMRIPLVYTLEASFFGKKKQNNSFRSSQTTENIHFTIQDYKDIGQQFCLSLYKILYDEIGAIDKSNAKPTQINLKQIETEMRAKMGDLDKEDNDSEGSAEDVSEDDLDDELMINLLPNSQLSKKQKKLKEQIKEVLKLFQISIAITQRVIVRREERASSQRTCLRSQETFYQIDYFLQGETMVKRKKIQLSLT